jgi:hypothetical protein
LLDDAEREDVLDIEDQLVAEMRSRGPQKNVSTFAFTATPKEKTLELFGHRDDRGRYAPFSLYSMRQAIEEGFILDVLQNYTTYQTYWKLLKTAEDDPTYERDKAHRLLRAFVELHDHAIGEKVRIMVEHFHQNVAHRINGRAKAMIVTRPGPASTPSATTLRWSGTSTSRGTTTAPSSPSPAPSATVGSSTTKRLSRDLRDAGLSAETETAEAKSLDRSWNRRAL